MVLLFYTSYISVDRAHHGVFRAKVGKGGIKDGYLLKLVSRVCQFTLFFYHPLDSQISMVSMKLPWSA